MTEQSAGGSPGALLQNVVPDERQTKRRHLLHIFASFGFGGVPIRICDVINALPPGFHHTIVALDARFDARKRLSPHVSAEFRELSLPKYCLPCSMFAFRDLMRRASPDLLLTYNWGAIECVLANRIFRLCDHVHFESGFGAEEASRQLWRRNLFRRFALQRVEKVIVPSNTLIKIATESWRVPPSKLLRIPNGVDVSRFHGIAGQRENGLLSAVGAYDTIIGTVAPLRPEKNVARLLRAFAMVPKEQNAALVIAGDGTELSRLRALARDLAIVDRTHFLGHVEDVPAVLRGMDIFALSSDTEQMPNSLLQAMATARPIAAVDVGDVTSIVSPENRPLVVPRDDEKGLAEALQSLITDPSRRKALGSSNQRRITSQYSLDGMVAAYGALLGAI